MPPLRVLELLTPVGLKKLAWCTVSLLIIKNCGDTYYHIDNIGRTDGRTDGLTDGRMDRNKYCISISRVSNQYPFQSS